MLNVLRFQSVATANIERFETDDFLHLIAGWEVQYHILCAKNKPPFWTNTSTLNSFSKALSVPG